MTAPSALPSIWGVAAGIADADMVGASARAQPVNPIIISRFILVPSPLWQVLLRIISSTFATLAEQRIHRPFRTVATDSWNSAASWNLGGECFDGGRRLPKWVKGRSTPAL
jgi:hypothetical protein